MSYSKLVGSHRVRVMELPDIFVEGVPWDLYYDYRGNYYCGSVDGADYVEHLHAKTYEDAVKETTLYVVSFFM